MQIYYSIILIKMYKFNDKNRELISLKQFGHNKKTLSPRSGFVPTRGEVTQVGNLFSN